MIEEELARKFVNHEVLEGADAAAIMTELYGFGTWRIYLTAAIAEMREGNAERAWELVHEVLAEHEGVPT